jgi:hypothetical protein
MKQKDLAIILKKILEVNLQMLELLQTMKESKYKK